MYLEKTVLLYINLCDETWLGYLLLEITERQLLVSVPSSCSSKGALNLEQVQVSRLSVTNHAWVFVVTAVVKCYLGEWTLE